MSIGYFIPPVNLFGSGCSEEVGAQAKLLGGTRALLVTDEYLGRCGMADKIRKILEQAGLHVTVFAGAEPNPTDKNVEDGVAVWKANQCDLLVSLGGGSSHDCAKGIGLIVANGGKITDHEGVDKSSNEFVPFLAVNTTAGTAAEMTRFAVITDTSRKVKMAIVDWRITPKVSFNDPLLMVEKPQALTAATGMDALTHAVEAYVSTAANPLTDSAALMAIKLIAEWLPKAVANGANIEAREKMAYAQFLAGMAFNNAVLGYVHSMAHQLGGIYNLPHGVCNAILLPHVEQFNLIACQERFRDIAVAMGERVEGLSMTDAAQKAIDAIKVLSASIGIPSGLAELGVQEKDFDIMATNAKLDACQLTNPRTATKEEVIQIYRNAM
jgi:alcohol dehydrogenase